METNRDAERPEATPHGALRDEEERGADRDPLRSHRQRVVYLPSWQ
jgi:hypothetical protein